MGSPLDAELEASHDRQLERTHEIMVSVDDNLRHENERQMEKLRWELALLDSPVLDDEIGAWVRDDPEAALILLDDAAERWIRFDDEGLQGVGVGELSEAIAAATVLAGNLGLPLERLKTHYVEVKRAVREISLDTPPDVPPERDSWLGDDAVDDAQARLYWPAALDFFGSSAAEIAEVRAQNQEFRIIVFKRISIAYLRSLLAWTREPPACEVRQPKGSVTIRGIEIPVLGCADPVLDEFEAYVEAVKKIQSGAAIKLGAEADLRKAELQFLSDFIAILPVMGDALDLYSVYMGEDLAGNCLSPAQRSLTIYFIVAPEALGYVLTRTDVGRRAAANIADFLEYGANRFGDNKKLFYEGMARLWGRSQDEMASLSLKMQGFSDEAIDAFQAAGKAEARALADQAAMAAAEATLAETMELAAEGLEVMDSLPSAYVRRANARARRFLDAYLLRRVDQDYDAVRRASNMVPEHFDEFVNLARERGEILMFREINPHARKWIEAGYPTKDMSVKGKSSSWGPHAGLIPVDQSLSKMGDPSKTINPAQIKKFQGQVDKCIESGICKKVAAETLDMPPRKIFVLDGKPVLKDIDGRFLDPDSGELLTLTKKQQADAIPMEVLAAPDRNGVLKPLTADYDLMMVGRKKAPDTPGFDSTFGWGSPQDADTLDALNRKASASGGNVGHHSAERLYPGSPGALTQDGYVTVMHPTGKPLNIPTCDAACMRQWCDATNACGGLPICTPRQPRPCFPIEPDRLLMDYIHAVRREDGFNLGPNAVWNWGKYSAIGGWTAQANLKRVGSLEAQLARRAVVAANTSYFKCSDKSKTPGPLKTAAAGN